MLFCFGLNMLVLTAVGRWTQTAHVVFFNGKVALNGGITGIDIISVLGVQLKGVLLGYDRDCHSWSS